MLLTLNSSQVLCENARLVHWRRGLQLVRLGSLERGTYECEGKDILPRRHGLWYCGGTDPVTVTPVREIHRSAASRRSTHVNS